MYTSDVSIQTISSVSAEFFPQDSRILVEVPFFEDLSKRGRAFLAAVAGAKPNTCLELQPGIYPAVNAARNVFIRAAIPGTVAFVAKPGQAVVATSARCVLLQGISLQPAPGESTAVTVRSGCLILVDCDVQGSMTTGKSGNRLYLAKCRTTSPGVGLQVAAGSLAVIETSAFLNCAIGIIGDEGSRLIARHSRFHGCGRTGSTSSGTAIRALKASVELSGCRFVDNRKGVKLESCPEATLTACLFDSNGLGGVIALWGNPPKLNAVQFWGLQPGGPEHVLLTGVEAEVWNCTFNDASLNAGIVPETNVLPESAGPLERQLHQLKRIDVSREIKTGLERVLRNAQSAFQYIEQGLPMPVQLFHCVFEGEPHLGQHRVAALLANSLKELGFLSTNKIVEVPMDTVVLHRHTLEDIARDAEGGILFLHVSRVLNRREAHGFYTKTRELLEAFIEAAGKSSVLIFSGDGETVRPVLKKSSLAETFGRQVVTFSSYAPGELMHVFITFCESHKILLTPRALEKLLITFYMLDDRRDKRFITSADIRNLFEASEKRHRQRCSDQNDFNQPMDEYDLHLPLQQTVNRVMAAQPELVAICPNCGTQSPWLPGPTEAISRCPECGHGWEPGWGVWKESTYFRRLSQREEMGGGLEDSRPVVPRFKS